MFARPLIDSVEFARNGKELSGEVPAALLPRLSDTLTLGGEKLNYRVKGSQEGNRYFLSVDLNGLFHMRCQRCMGDLDYPFELTSKLELVSSELLEQFDEEEDSDAIEASRQLDLYELFEDEVLLNLPFAPKHALGECSAVEASLQQSANPFSVLAVLKKK